MSFSSRFPVFLVVTLVAFGSLWATDTTTAARTATSASEIVRRMTASNLKRASELNDYHSTRIYELDYSGFPSGKHARMVASVDFQAGKKTFTVVSEEGSRLLLNRVLRRLLESEQEAADRENLEKTALTESNYSFQLLGNEVVDGRPCYMLQVNPKRDNRFLYDGRIWVDAQDFAVVRIEAQPAKNPSFWISQTTVEHHYLKRGEFWLPASNRSSSKVRMGGRAVLTIDYGRYEVINGRSSLEGRSQASAN